MRKSLLNWLLAALVCKVAVAFRVFSSCKLSWSLWSKPEVVRKDKKSRFFFADDLKEDVRTSSAIGEKVIERKLGSQELLMLPRQYQPKGKNVPLFPSMSHVCSIKLSKTPSLSILNKALEILAWEHPLLHCGVAGDGEPMKRVDLFQMVREGDPDPCRFILLDNINIKAKLVTLTDTSVKRSFGELLDNGLVVYNDSTALLWNVELHTNDGPATSCSLVFQWNHAISDQSTVQVVIDHLLHIITALENGTQPPTLLDPTKSNIIPPSLEQSLLGDDHHNGIQTLLNFGTIRYILNKAKEGLYNPVILPDKSINKQHAKRSSVLQFRTLSSQTTQALLQQCRKHNVTMTHLLTAVMSVVSSNYIPSSHTNKLRNYKILQSLDMRRYETNPSDSIITPCCHAGSMDIMAYHIPDYSSKDKVWHLAQQGKIQTQHFITTNGPYHSIKVFDFATTIADITNLVHLTSQSNSTMGRAYTAAVVNAGVYEKLPSCHSTHNLQTKVGHYTIQDLYFATSHVNTGSLYPMSVVTINNQMKFTFHPVHPIVTHEENQSFADDYIQLLNDLAQHTSDNPIAVNNNVLGLGAIAAGIAINIPHLPAWTDFFSSVWNMKEVLGANSADFVPAVNFWIFFAVGHAILQPILFLSDVLHGSPGPLIGGLVPASFLFANVMFITAFTISQEVRNLMNILLLSLFLNYVGSGLEGKLGLGDYNLAVNDSYQGKVIKGCPAYDDVKLDSMNDFDITKYQGKWYEHKFHDWTQFKEVYDTTLDIKLTPDGKGWIDDFAVKGPAPNAAKLSWDKSPVANGAHYFLFGRIDDNDPPGVLRESGFGVEFPNYIVDVQKDPNTGEYTEAIQFQCLERGGVRVFEGINFMSRNPVMTDVQLKNMHERAKKAGMYPYGASEEQMHRVERRDVGAPDIDNSWQQMWRNLGVDKLLELLTESIEDGGR